MSLSKEPKEPAHRYLEVLTRRRRGQPEAQIAAALGFDSPAALYQCMVRDGYPVCRECGEADVPQDHCSRRSHRKARRGDRRGTELPPASNAVALFQEALEELQAAADILDERVEFLKDERFVAMYVSHDDKVLPHQDPTRTTFYGASQYPPDPLPALIAAYVLIGGQPDDFLDKLHYEPSEVDRNQLGKAAERLRLEARKLAQIVRGAKPRRGPSTGQLSSQEQLIAQFISRHRSDGVFSDSEILNSLKRLGFDVSLEEMRRLERLRIPWPRQ